uniref:Uncharacterized protein n=1 Tax=Anopheles farauti TaxID=69004 RepID=A0A182QHG8_9DIPT
MPMVVIVALTATFTVMIMIPMVRIVVMIDIDDGAPVLPAIALRPALFRSSSSLGEVGDGFSSSSQYFSKSKLKSSNSRSVESEEVSSKRFAAVVRFLEIIATLPMVVVTARMALIFLLAFIGTQPACGGVFSARFRRRCVCRALARMMPVVFITIPVEFFLFRLSDLLQVLDRANALPVIGGTDHHHAI